MVLSVYSNKETRFKRLLQSFLFVTVCFITITSCNLSESTKVAETVTVSFKGKERKGKGELELALIQHGLLDIKEAVPSLQIDLRYTTPNNFVGIDLYGDLERVFLQPDVADKVKKAQRLLKEKDSTLTLLIFDGVRPLRIQQLMWDSLKLPLSQKIKFLSNPRNHSLHNYGAAVDLSIANINGEELDMGTPYDFAGKLAYPRLEAHFVQQGKLSAKQINNRKLLRSIMSQSGFTGITTEWWHFNSCTRAQAKVSYQLVK